MGSKSRQQRVRKISQGNALRELASGILRLRLLLTLQTFDNLTLWTLGRSTKP